MTITYRKMRNDVWVVCGPVRELGVGDVQVTTKAGERKRERVFGIGEPFDLDGVVHAYGYLQESDWDAERRDRAARRPCMTGGDCRALGTGNCGGYDCDA